MNYYPFHVGDYTAHTAHLDPMEDIAYRRLLDLYYLREEPIHCDPAEAARLVRLRANVGEVTVVLQEFFTLTDDGWRHGRCDAELLKMQDKQSKARASAAASVNARKANAQRSVSERATEAELPTPTPTPTKSESKALVRQAARFDEFWKAYPNKTGRKPCQLKWTARNLDALADTIIQDVKTRIAEDRRWQEGFIPNPETYLNQDRWNDEIQRRPNGAHGTPSKTLAGMQALQGMKRGNGLVPQRDSGRFDQADVIEPGPDACRRLGSADRGDVG